MEPKNEQDIKLELLNLQLRKEKHFVSLQEIILNHLENAIEERDSATVAAMAEILKR